MRKLISVAIVLLLLMSVCIVPAYAERIEADGIYEYPAEKTDEILAGKAGEATTTWSVPYLPISPTLDGTINAAEYLPLENFEDYITFVASKNYDEGGRADALYQKVKEGIFDAYWCWDDTYLYLAFDVECVDGYACTPEGMDVMLFAYNCLQVGLADVNAQGRDASYTELGFGYDAENQRNVSFAWTSQYRPSSDDLACRYNESTGHVTYELRIDLQQALGWERPIENGDQCNFAYVLQLSGDGDMTTDAQVLFCHGIAGQYSKKYPEYFARITFDGKPDNVIVTVGTETVTEPGPEAEYELREMIDFSSPDVFAFATMVGEGAELTHVTEGEDTFLRLTAKEDGCYTYSTVYPRNLLSDFKYLVIKYRTASPKGGVCGVIWQTRTTPEYNTEQCYTTYIDIDGEWRYAVLDMSDTVGWQYYILNLGIVPFYGEENVAGEVIDIAWIKAYAFNPSEYYDSLNPHQTLSPEIEIPSEDTTMPYFEETIVEHYRESEWETFEEQQILGGLFFEVFGDDATVVGCQGEPIGCRSGGCRAVTGGFLVIFLFGIGIMFRKKESS